MALANLGKCWRGWISNSRGRGLFLAFDLPDEATRERVLNQMFDEGVLGLRSGHRAIRFRPPLSLGFGEADEGLLRLESALQQPPP